MATLYSGFSRLGGLALSGLLAAGAAAPAWAAQARNLTQPARPSIEEVAREKAHQAYDRLTHAQTSASTRIARPVTSGVRAVSAPLAAGSLRCLPTCSTTDGRFLAIAGTAFDTLSPPEMDLSIAVPADAATFDIGIFDGDGGEYQSDGVTAYWDAGLTAAFEYSLYADPDANGTGSVQIDLEPGSPTIQSADMPDNDWRDFTVSTGPEAASPSGNFFYVLKVRLVDPTVVTLNAFKVRTTAVVGGLTLDPVARPFSYIASWTAESDISVIYPNFPDTTPTTYDGNFSFYFDVPSAQSELILWDGDFDHGKWDLTDQDTDDPDTPPLFIPPWATPETLPEGIAIGAPGTGSPPDDDNDTGFGAYTVRPPSVEYVLKAPDGQSFLNANPSGNLEWERFRISTAPFNASTMDYSVPAIPAGTYKLEIHGVDMLNLNALLMPYRVLCVDDTDTPCVPLRPYRVGDTVFRDTDGDGVQDAGEPGVAGVTLELHDALGTTIATTTTDAAGHYSFEVDKGSYTVRVTASNFAPGGPLAGDASTTGGDSDTSTVTNDNDLGLDFGYRGTASIGDRVWNDVDADGVQDTGEAGLNGVTVRLLDGGGNVVATAVTSGNGNYTFANLAAGTYTVRVDNSTLPAGYSPTADPDGLGTPNQASVTVAAGASVTTADFGYRASAQITLGDRVWSDTDGDGVQDSGEPGLNGVAVQLLSSSGTVIATTTTSGDGNYAFANLSPGTYSVRVVASTLPAGMTPTYDLDGTATPNIATVNASGSLSTVDFGYRPPAPPSQPGTGTLGYWKTHPEAWPVQQITIGGITYSKAQAIVLMSNPGMGDKTYDLFKQLVAAKLNVLIGNDASCISSTISAADSWMASHPAGSKVKSSSSAWTVAGPLHSRLDTYNNGGLCAPHRN